MRSHLSSGYSSYFSLINFVLVLTSYYEGSCENCTETMKQKCYCGKEQEERICGTDIIDNAMGEERHFSCGALCDRYWLVLCFVFWLIVTSSGY